jgi:ankyrin repeat protein
MQTLPDRANLVHLRKQAKDLLRLYRSGDADAIARFGRALPAAAKLSRDEIVSRAFRLHDAQSCIAREYGFPSWADLASYVDAQSLARGDQVARLSGWLALVYDGDVTGSLQPARPRVAVRVLVDTPDLASNDPYAASAVGNEAVLRQTAAADPEWVNRPGGPLKLPPLVAVTHSRLGQVPEFRDRLHRSAQFLLQAGADPNQRIGNRFPPASLAAPDENMPLSALYGAAGVNRDPALTSLLLDAGADPNDGEALYHSLENPDCTRLLLLRGARVRGTNALRRSLDMADPAALELLLAHGGDPNEPASGPPTSDWGAPLLRAIALRRSSRHIEALLAAGADPSARTPGGISAYRLALQVGMQDVAEVLRKAGAEELLSPDEQFVAACARGDAAEARRIQQRRPHLPASLPEAQLRLLPDTVAWGADAAARVMVELGWPLAVQGGDWKASPLNLAVFRGDASLAEFLLDHGASWREQHGHGDDVLGTLSWASINEPAADGDWAACARALVAHGIPMVERDPAESETVLIGGRRARFSTEVTEVLLGADDAPSDSG